MEYNDMRLEDVLNEFAKSNISEKIMDLYIKKRVSNPLEREYYRQFYSICRKYYNNEYTWRKDKNGK